MLASPTGAAREGGKGGSGGELKPYIDQEMVKKLGMSELWKVLKVWFKSLKFNLKV